jgi:mono/diheme cytochrome c family protein
VSDGGGYMKYGVIGVLVLGIGLVAWRNLGPSGDTRRGPEFVVPQTLSETATQGKKGFDENCAGCHGTNAVGTDQGPPLIHDYYNPGHHADGAFYNAVRNGVRQHHWRFGNMPPQPRVTDEQTRFIVAYVREMQEANGIRYKPH